MHEPGNLPHKFKLSKFTKVFKADDCIGIYHSLLVKKVLGKKLLKDISASFKKYTPVSEFTKRQRNKKQALNEVNKLIEKGFLIKKGVDEKLFQEVQKSTLLTKPHIKQLFLYVTNDCNLSCKYCRQATKRPAVSDKMSESLAKKGIDFFVKNLVTEQDVGIVFFGGEPLLNFKLIKNSIRHINKVKKQGKLPKNMSVEVFTNCTLANKEMAKFFAKERVSFIASIDGPKQINDKMRVKRNGKGSFEEASKGYLALQKEGCDLCIFSTVGSHNVNNLKSTVNYFLKEMKPVSLGLNLLHDFPGNPASVPQKTASKKIIEAYDYFKDKGIWIEQVGRIVRLFYEEKIRMQDCPACGGRIVIFPNGQIGPCEGTYELRRFQTKLTKKAVEKEKLFTDWAARSPFNIKKCKNCAGIAICGGGCPLDAYAHMGDIWQLDIRNCVFVKDLVRWSMLNLLKQNRKEIKQNKLLFLQKKHQKFLFGKVKLYSKNYPLRSSSFFGEIPSKRIWKKSFQKQALRTC